MVGSGCGRFLLPGIGSGQEFLHFNDHPFGEFVSAGRDDRNLFRERGAKPSRNEGKKNGRIRPKAERAFRHYFVLTRGPEPRWRQTVIMGATAGWGKNYWLMVAGGFLPAGNAEKATVGQRTATCSCRIQL